MQGLQVWLQAFITVLSSWGSGFRIWGLGLNEGLRFRGHEGRPLPLDPSSSIGADGDLSTVHDSACLPFKSERVRFRVSVLSLTVKFREGVGFGG